MRFQICYCRISFIHYIILILVIGVILYNLCFIFQYLKEDSKVQILITQPGNLSSGGYLSTVCGTGTCHF